MSSGTVAPTGFATVLTSTSPTDENSFDQPTKVKPVSRMLDGLAKSFTFDFAPYSVTVLRVAPRADQTR